MRWLCLALVLLSRAHPVMAETPTRNVPVYRHAYYLFLAGTPKGCEECYVPLLITKERLELIVESQQIAESVLITTYERDSIWQIEPPVLLKPTDIEVPQRMIRIGARAYRYQEITPAEVLRLLENPQGRIPISRLKAPPSRESLADLASDFRAIK